MTLDLNNNSEIKRRDWLTPAIHPAYARLMCAHLRNQGVDLEVLFNGNSLSVDSLMTQSAFVSYEQFQRLIVKAIALTKCPWLGLEISSMIQVSAHGPLGYGALAAQTVEQAFRLVEKAMKTRITIFDFKLIEKESFAVFELNETFDVGELKEFIFTMLLGSFLDMLEKASASTSKGVLVYFPFSEPSWSDKYLRRFEGIDIFFDHSGMEIHLPRALMSAYCLTADEFVYRNALRECDALLLKQQKGGDLSDRIKAELFDSGAPYPSQEEVAVRYNVSTRTLIRRLKAEGGSYQALLDDVRKNKHTLMFPHLRLLLNEYQYQHFHH